MRRVHWSSASLRRNAGSSSGATGPITSNVHGGAAATASSNPERAAAAMLRVRDTGREALGEMRRMLAVLRDDEPAGLAPGPGAQDLEALVDEAQP